MKRRVRYQTHTIIRIGRVVILIEKKPKVRKVKVKQERPENLGYVYPNVRVL